MMLDSPQQSFTLGEEQELPLQEWRADWRLPARDWLLSYALR